MVKADPTTAAVAAAGAAAPGPVRWFVALKPAPELAAALARLADPDLPGCRWVPAEEIHLTLRFLGDVPAPARMPLRTALGHLPPLEPFWIDAQGAGCFPPRGPASVLWAGWSAHPRLQALRHAIERAVLATGLPADERSYVPHVTLARSRGLAPGVARRWTEAAARAELPAWRVEGWTLFDSAPRPAASGAGDGPGPRHRPVVSRRLGAEVPAPAGGAAAPCA